MTTPDRDEVLKLAMDVDAFIEYTVDDVIDALTFTPDQLESFASAVAEREREECEKLVVAIRNDWNDDDQILKAVAADYLAEAIRARGQR